MPWQLLTLIGVVMLSVSVLLQRILLHKDKGDPIAYAIVFQTSVAILTGTYAVIQGFEMPDLSRLWFPILACTLLFAFENVVYAKALQVTEASVFSTLYATNTFWVMLASVVIFHETLGFWHMIGALLIFTGVAILTDRSGKLKIDRGTWLSLATGFLYGLASSAWAYVGRSSDAASWTALSFAGPALVILVVRPGSARKVKPFLSGAMLVRMLVLASIIGVAAICLMHAFQRGNVSAVAPLQQTSTILTILLAIVVLHERSRIWHKLIAAAVCFAGVLLIV